MKKLPIINVWKCHRETWESAFLSLHILSKSEQQKLNEYKIEDDRKRFCAGRVMVRKISGRNIGIDAGNIEISINNHGKPYLKDYNHLHFNISHSGDWVITAFSEYEIGVDVQEICPNKKIDYKNVAKHAFHKDEINYVLDAPYEKQRHRFYDIWCVKEAVIKAMGTGFYGNLDGFCVLPLPNKTTTNINGFKVRELIIDQQHVGALATLSDATPEIKYFDFSNFQEIYENT